MKCPFVSRDQNNLMKRLEEYRKQVRYNDYIVIVGIRS